MESKKHLQAQKKVTKAVSAFDSAILELTKASELTAASILADQDEMKAIEKQIENLWKVHDLTQATIIEKQAALHKQVDLSIKLSEFTI